LKWSTVARNLNHKLLVSCFLFLMNCPLWQESWTAGWFLYWSWSYNISMIWIVCLSNNTLKSLKCNYMELKRNLIKGEEI
jgi:hypothetical protein